jgi:S1-C subfamily serine protease
VHPSELPGSFDKAAVPPTHARVPRRFQVAVATAASALLATGGILLSNPVGTQPAGALSGPHVATSLDALPSPVRGAAHATIALQILEQSHVGTATAMVLPPGDLAVTTAPIPTGASVIAYRPDDETRIPLTVVGSDHMLGVTVLRMPFSAPVTATGPLDPAVATGGAPTALTALAAIKSAAPRVEFQYAAAYLNASPTPRKLGHSTIAVTHGVSLVGVVPGSLVLDARGRAVAASVPALGHSSFVPATFLKLLAQRIVLGNTTGHGWLQVSGHATSRGPATVASVTVNGPGWGHVYPGDTIVAIDSHAVRTMADVGSILYTSSPGQSVQLTLLHHGATVVVDVRLTSRP